METDGNVSALMRRVTWRLMPFIMIIYIASFLDRSNLGNAHKAMIKDLGITEEQYGISAAIFFLPYALFEVPSNMIMERINARRWITRIMVSWGIFATLLAASVNFGSLLAIRVFLGLSESGFFPGIVLYLTYWFSPKERAQRMAILYSAQPVAGLLGGLLAYGILRLDGLGGLHGWQWLFIAEGVPTILLGFTVFFVLPDGPEDAPWLTSEERDFLLLRAGRKSKVNNGQRRKKKLSDGFFAYDTLDEDMVPSSVILDPPPLLTSPSEHRLKTSLVSPRPVITESAADLPVSSSVNHRHPRDLQSRDSEPRSDSHLSLLNPVTGFDLPPQHRVHTHHVTNSDSESDGAGGTRAGLVTDHQLSIDVVNGHATHDTSHGQVARRMSKAHMLHQVSDSHVKHHLSGGHVANHMSDDDQLVPDLSTAPAQVLAQSSGLVAVTPTAAPGQNDDDGHGHLVLSWLVLRETLSHPSVWCFALANFLMLVPMYSVSFYLPAIIAEFGVGALEGNLLSTVPYGIATLFMLVNSYHSDRQHERLVHILTANCVEIIGFGLLAISGKVPEQQRLAFKMVTVTIAATGVWGSKAIFMAWISESLRGNLAVAIATVTSFGNVAGLAGPLIMGECRHVSGAYTLGILVLMGFQMAAVVIIVALPFLIARDSRLSLHHTPSHASSSRTSVEQ